MFLARVLVRTYIVGKIRELEADGVPIPSSVTPMLYFKYWNMLYMRDKKREA